MLINSHKFNHDRYVDDEIVGKVCELPLREASPENVVEAVLHGDPSQGHPALNRVRHELKVAYDLLLDAKRHKLRIADVMLAFQDSSRTPPANSPLRIHNAGTSPSSSKMEFSGTSTAHGGVRHAMQETRDTQSRRRRWYLGIQSKKDPAHVMREVYKAMQQLRCTWYQVNNYRVLCLWNQGQPSNPLGFLNPFRSQTEGSMDTDSVATSSPDIVRIALTLYKVQQNIYLLDFQRVEGDAFSFMKLCARIITELKNLSAASRNQAQLQQQQQQQQPAVVSGGVSVNRS